MRKEELIICNDEKIEQIAHEITMIWVKEEFESNFKLGTIRSGCYTDWMLNLYHQGKKRALWSLKTEYDIVYRDL